MWIGVGQAIAELRFPVFYRRICISFICGVISTCGWSEGSDLGCTVETWRYGMCSSVTCILHRQYRYIINAASNQELGILAARIAAMKPATPKDRIAQPMASCLSIPYASNSQNMALQPRVAST